MLLVLNASLENIPIKQAAKTAVKTARTTRSRSVILQRVYVNMAAKTTGPDHFVILLVLFPAVSSVTALTKTCVCHVQMDSMLMDQLHV